MTALERARATAYPAGEYVGQESFMRAAEVRRLAHQAQVGPGVSVLDLCCGVAGPGRMITTESRCHYLGVDHSASALATARQLAGNLSCRFEQAHLPPLPEGRFEVVFLLETMLAFPDKDALIGEVARVLEPGGRFAQLLSENTGFPPTGLTNELWGLAVFAAFHENERLYRGVKNCRKCSITKVEA